MGSRYRGSRREVRALSALINLMRAADSLGAAQARALAREGLTLPQFGVLEALYHLGPMCQKDLSRKLLRTGGNITMVVNHLERAGLVRRRRRADDRRFVEVALTARGRRRIEAVLPGHVARVVRQMDALDPAEQDALREMCRRLGRNAAKEETDAEG